MVTVELKIDENFDHIKSNFQSIVYTAVVIYFVFYLSAKDTRCCFLVAPGQDSLLVMQLGLERADRSAIMNQIVLFYLLRLYKR